MGKSERKKRTKSMMRKTPYTRPRNIDKILERARKRTKERSAIRSRMNRKAKIELFAQSLFNGKKMTELSLDYTMNSKKLKNFMIDIDLRLRELIKLEEIKNDLKKLREENPPERTQSEDLVLDFGNLTL
jgi:hypothetical protein